MAGKRGGLQDNRGALFFEIARVLADKEPRYFLLENVKGILSHEDGRTFAQIIGVLADIGYLVQWEVLNSKFFGVPQNRERIFIIGHLRGFPRPEVFPIGNGNQPVSEARDGGNNITAGCLGTRCGSGQSNFDGSTTVVYDVPRGAKKGGFSKRATMRTLSQSQFQYNTMIVANTVTDGWLMRGERDRDENGKSVLTSMNKRRIRRLTPGECEKLQGFPDYYTKWGINDDGFGYKISDTQRYKMLGNAVTTTVIKAIAEKF